MVWKGALGQNTHGAPEGQGLRAKFLEPLLAHGGGVVGFIAAEVCLTRQFVLDGVGRTADAVGRQFAEAKAQEASRTQHVPQVFLQHPREPGGLDLRVDADRDII